ncbi:MAG: alginate O-acetyltransferase AlgX-related protein [Verrucomicrobiales bacterium]
MRKSELFTPWTMAFLFAASPVLRATPADFAADCARRAAAADAARQRVVPGDAPGWLFTTSDLKHLGLGEFWEKRLSNGDPVDVISSYQKSLQSLGIEMVVVPVPPKASIYPDKLNAGMSAEGGVFATEPFFEKLRTVGVTVVDLEPIFRSARARDKVYCEQDSHWSPLACRLAAESISALPSVRKLFAVQEPALRAGEEITITGDLVDAMPKAVSGKETLSVFKAAAQPLPPDDESPVLLIGDSHTVVFSEAAGTIRHHTTGAGLRDHLQVRLGTAMAVATNASSGGDGARALVARKTQSNPDFWKGKKLVVWCFATRELTQGRWREIPPQP